ncbi:hypothetical protein RB620_21225, partial [Paenibacillus sp. LHD-117]|uniref:hypothetical protein n=1 Tax=Paenibacillus sp. LHD-117 TaxID=3071412 RepID=UPI0027DFF59E
FVNGGSHFHFTKKRFLFVISLDKNGASPQVNELTLWDSPSSVAREAVPFNSFPILYQQHSFATIAPEE